MAKACVVFVVCIESVGEQVSRTESIVFPLKRRNLPNSTGENTAGVPRIIGKKKGNKINTQKMAHIPSLLSFFLP
jgi:hypothetical protein